MITRCAGVQPFSITATGCGGPGNATQVLSLYAFQTAYSRLVAWELHHTYDVSRQGLVGSGV